MQWTNQPLTKPEEMMSVIIILQASVLKKQVKLLGCMYKWQWQKEILKDLSMIINSHFQSYTYQLIPSLWQRSRLELDDVQWSSFCYSLHVRQIKNLTCSYSFCCFSLAYSYSRELREVLSYDPERKTSYLKGRTCYIFAEYRRDLYLGWRK